MPDTTFALRAPIIAALAPLGWTLDMLGHAANCSAAVIRKDLQPRGGLTGAFPNRPTGNGVYAATFKCYVMGELPNEAAIAVATKFLEIERLECLTEGMERGLAALQNYAFPPAHRPYLMLVKSVCHIQPERTSFGGWRAWDRYCDDVRGGQRPPPHRWDVARDGIEECFRNTAERLDITLTVPDDDIVEAVTALLATLDDNERFVITRLYGLETGKPQTMKDVGKEMGVTYERVRQTEWRALHKLRNPSWGTTLSRFVGTLSGLIDEVTRLRAEIIDLKTESAALRADYKEVKLAVAEGRDPQTIINGQNLHLFQRLDDVAAFSVRTTNCLMNTKIEYVYQLVERTEDDLLKTRNFGRKSINEIKEILGDLGLSLGMKLPASFNVGKLANT